MSQPTKRNILRNGRRINFRLVSPYRLCLIITNLLHSELMMSKHFGTRLYDLMTNSALCLCISKSSRNLRDVLESFYILWRGLVMDPKENVLSFMLFYRISQGLWSACLTTVLFGIFISISRLYCY